MTFPLAGVEPETFEQANPFLTGFTQMLSNSLTAQQANQAALENQYLQQQLPYAGGLAQANLLNQQGQAQQSNAAGQVAQGSIQANILGNQLKDVSGSPVSANAAAILAAQRLNLLPQSLVDIYNGNNGGASGVSTSNGPANVNTTTGLPTLPNGLTPQQAQAMGINLKGLTLGGTQPTINATNPENIPGSNNPYINSLPSMGGNPLGPYYNQAVNARNTALQEQAKRYINDWNDARDQASKASNTATDIINSMNDYDTGYDKAYYKGPSGGAWPSAADTGSLKSMAEVYGESKLSPNKNLANEQLADRSANNVVALMNQGMIAGHPTNTEWKAIASTKPDRTLDPATKALLSQKILSTAYRTQEMPGFYNAAQNSNLTKQQADVLWNKYNILYPVINPKTGQVNTQFKNLWPNVLTPQSIAQVQTQTAQSLPQVSQPSAAVGHTYSQQYSDDDLAHTAAIHHMTIPQVLARLGAQ